MTDLMGAIWRESSRSGGDGGQCVEVADNFSGIVGVRDSKDPTRAGVGVRSEGVAGVRAARPALTGTNLSPRRRRRNAGQRL